MEKCAVPHRAGLGPKSLRKFHVCVAVMNRRHSGMSGFSIWLIMLRDTSSWPATQQHSALKAKQLPSFAYSSNPKVKIMAFRWYFTCVTRYAKSIYEVANYTKACKVGCFSPSRRLNLFFFFSILVTSWPDWQCNQNDVPFCSITGWSMQSSLLKFSPHLPE